MPVDDAFGRPGAARREQDSRYFVAPGGHGLFACGEPCRAERFDLRQCVLCQTPAANGNRSLHRRPAPAKGDASRVRDGNSDECAGLRAREALAQPLDAETRVDHHRYHAGLEHSEGQGEELGARSHHERGAMTALDSNGVEAGGDSAAALVELSIRDLGVDDVARRVALLRREEDGRRIGLRRGHLRQHVGHRRKFERHSAIPKNRRTSSSISAGASSRT